MGDTIIFTCCFRFAACTDFRWNSGDEGLEDALFFHGSVSERRDDFSMYLLDIFFKGIFLVLSTQHYTFVSIYRTVHHNTIPT